MILADADVFDGVRKYIPEHREESNRVEHVFDFYFRIGFIVANVVVLAYTMCSLISSSNRFFRENFEIYFYLLDDVVISRQANSIAYEGLMRLFATPDSL
jgi:hypothetical protein